MAPKRPKRPRDPVQLGKLIVDLSVGDAREVQPPDSPATEFARTAGLMGGKARAARLTAAERSKIARKGAQARWGKRALKPSK